MYLSLGQAAKSKSVIHNALKNGKLSGSRNDAGQWEIDPAELFRVFPKNSQNPKKEQNRTPENPQSEQQNREILRLEQTIEDLREQRDQWRKPADQWQQQAASATALLTDQRKQGGFWARLFSSKG